MDHVNSNQPATERRRSDRLFEPVPLVVRGIDLLGQPFEERTATLALNLHGCRYSSKHHLPKNTWVTLELPQTQNRPNVRARVAWVQRPHSIRDFFQVAVELEDPANIWGLDALPEDWATAEGSFSNEEQVEPKSKLRKTRRFGLVEQCKLSGDSRGPYKRISQSFCIGRISFCQ